MMVWRVPRELLFLSLRTPVQNQNLARRSCGLCFIVCILNSGFFFFLLKPLSLNQATRFRERLCLCAVWGDWFWDGKLLNDFYFPFSGLIEMKGTRMGKNNSFESFHITTTEQNRATATKKAALPQNLLLEKGNRKENFRVRVVE